VEKIIATYSANYRYLVRSVVVVHKVDGRWTVSQSIEWPVDRPEDLKLQEQQQSRVMGLVKRVH
jgi:hypothetical protein